MMESQDTQKQGEELNQLSRLIFDHAAMLWTWGFGLEFLAGILGLVVGIIELSSTPKLIAAIVVFLILASSYVLKISVGTKYDDAETMRRQSILAEALNWPIGSTQFSRWRLRAGSRLLKTFKVKPRDEDYYSTQQPIGPRKLLEMTIESAFFTRHLYTKIKNVLLGLCIVLSVLFILTLSIVPITSVNTRLELVYLLYLALPLFISLDLLGWVIKLGRVANSIEGVERDFESLESESEPEVVQVMRLVSEYNCQVTNGFPIPNWAFKYWHDEIQELWLQRPKEKWFRGESTNTN